MENRPREERAEKDATGVPSDVQRLFEESSFGSPQAQPSCTQLPAHLVTDIVRQVRTTLAVDVDNQCVDRQGGREVLQRSRWECLDQDLSSVADEQSAVGRITHLASGRSHDGCHYFDHQPLPPQSSLTTGANALRDNRIAMADDVSPAGRGDSATANIPISQPINANPEQSVANRELARSPANWQNVPRWTDIDRLSSANVAPTVDLPPQEATATANPASNDLEHPSPTREGLDGRQQRSDAPRGSRHDQSFGALLHHHRLAAGVSLGELSRQINYSKGQVSKIENGLKLPTTMFAELCDRALATNGALTAALPPHQARIEPAKPDEVWVLGLNDEGNLQYTEVPRRQLLAGAGALLGYAVTRAERPVIDDCTFSALRASFDQHRVLGTMTSPAMVLAPVIAHVHTLRTLAVDAPEPMRSNLLLLAARAAMYAGEMSQEAGRMTDASRWTDRAAQLAADRDPHMASFALFRHAEIALYQHDPVRTVELARRAQQDKTASPHILGLAARCEAQGHALAGDMRRCEEALDRATNLLSVPDPTNGPLLGSTSTQDEIALVRGWALYDLGYPRAAADLLNQHLTTIPQSARRARARFGIRRALAHAQSGSIDQACIAAREVLTDVAQVDSATIRLDLYELSRTLRHWRTHRQATDLRRDLFRVLHGDSPASHFDRHEPSHPLDRWHTPQQATDLLLPVLHVDTATTHLDSHKAADPRHELIACCRF